MIDRIISKALFDRVLPDGTYIRGEAKLSQVDGNASPHFSLTGSMWKSLAAYRRYESTRSEAGHIVSGAISDELVAAFPELEAFGKMHLADDRGAPLYAVENGWYWYSDYDGRGGTAPYEWHSMYGMTPHERGARYLRVTPDELPEGLTKEEFAEYVETLRPRWQEEADRAREFLDAHQAKEDAC